jgi:hypothetical protein
MKSGLGGSSASAVVSDLLNGHAWKLSGLMEMSACLGRPMNAGRRAIWALGMLQSIRNTTWQQRGALHQLDVSSTQ